MAELLHELFARAAQRYPTNVAVTLPSSTGDSRSTDSLTYEGLLAASHALCSLLAGHVSEECIVAIVLPKDSRHMQAAQLAVLQAGAAFVCVDLAFPDEHVQFLLEDSQAVVVLADDDRLVHLRQLGVAEGRLLDVAAAPAVAPAPARPRWLTERSLAYLIYTSGTTGRPKAVMIEHRSVVHLLDAEQDYLKLAPADRCVQVSSNAYDSSIEEVWLPLVAGATVVVADDNVTRLGPDLVPWLREQRISVLMPTPTMLRAAGCADPAAELPDLRLVYTGGEAITADLVDVWAPAVQLENGYGPTECTVTVTRSRLQRGAPITIGKPIGASHAHVLGEDLQPVTCNQDVMGPPGELCFSGPCLARGYWQREELTAEKFVEHPDLGRIYRSGDLVSRDENGDLHFLGRIDSQVKVRGYRIELAAIEAQLCELSGIREAACRVQGDVGRELLAAHVVVAPGTSADVNWMAERLFAVMPDYMVPARFALVDRLPTLVSGKLDRKALPEIAAPTGDAGATGMAPRTAEEQCVAAAFAETLGLEVIGVDVDFFDLGGNSLRAAELITRLRRESFAAGLAVRDVYELRTVAALCARAVQEAPAVGVERSPERELRGMPRLVTAVQVVWLACMLTVGTAAVYAALYLALPWLVAHLGLWPLVLLAPLIGAISVGIYVILAMFVGVVAKKVLIGAYREERAPAWGGLYLRNWIVQRCVSLVPWGLLQGTELYNVGLRALGAKVGKRVHVHRGVDLMAGGWDLLSLGDDVMLSQDAIVGLVEYDDGDIVFGGVTMGAGSTLEVRAGMQGGTALGRDVVIAALSSVARGTSVPDGEVWDGVPAKSIARSHAPPGPGQGARPRLSPLRYAATLFVVRSLLGYVQLAPVLAVLFGFLVWSGMTAEQWLQWLWQPSANVTLAFGLAGLSAVTVASRLGMSAVILRFARSVPAGCYHVGSLDYLRIWMRSGLLQASGRWLSGSLYWRWWLRCSGMDLGRNCEISTIIDVLPEQVAIGAETFFADGIYLGGPRLQRGTATVAMTSLSRDSFLGNHAVVPVGTVLPPHILIGVSTVANAEQVKQGTSWFGHPPMALPQREVVDLDRSLTHEPTALLYVHRLFWETLRFGLPVVTALVAFVWLEAASVVGGMWLPLCTLAAGGVLALLVLVAKWLLLGKVRPGTHGLWSAWCCRWDFLYMAWGMLAHGPLSPLGGTLLLPFYLRAMGMRIGKRVVLAGSFAQVVDPDMLTVADGATIDPMFQAHTFEDRVLKIGPVHIGQNATVGRATVVFYGTNIEPRCRVAPHSVVMKNETLSAGRDYAGVPTSPARK